MKQSCVFVLCSSLALSALGADVSMAVPGAQTFQDGVRKDFDALKATIKAGGK